MHDELASNDAVRSAIAAAQGLDLSILPKKMAGELEEGFVAAEAAIGQLDEAFAAHEAVVAAAPDYRPAHRTVRELERDIRDVNKEAEELKKDARFLNSDTDSARLAALNEKIAELEAEMAHIAEDIPESWEETYETFSALVAAEDKARSTYRRSSDKSVEGAVEFLGVLDANAAFLELEGLLTSLRDVIENTDPREAEGIIKEAGSTVNSVAGASKIGSALSKARRSMRPNKLDREKAMKEYDKAIALFEEQKVQPRLRNPVASGDRAYLAGIASTVGVSNCA